MGFLGSAFLTTLKDPDAPLIDLHTINGTKNKTNSGYSPLNLASNLRSLISVNQNSVESSKNDSNNLSILPDSLEILPNTAQPDTETSIGQSSNNKHASALLCVILKRKIADICSLDSTMDIGDDSETADSSEKSSSEGKLSHSSKDRNTLYFGTKRNKNFFTTRAGGPFECSTCCKQFHSKLMHEYHLAVCASKALMGNMDEQSQITTPNCNDSSEMSIGYLSPSPPTVEPIALIYNSNVNTRKVDVQEPTNENNIDILSSDKNTFRAVEPECPDANDFKIKREPIDCTNLEMQKNDTEVENDTIIPNDTTSIALIGEPKETLISNLSLLEKSCSEILLKNDQEPLIDLHTIDCTTNKSNSGCSPLDIASNFRSLIRVNQNSVERSKNDSDNVSILPDSLEIISNTAHPDIQNSIGQSSNYEHAATSLSVSLKRRIADKCSLDSTIDIGNNSEIADSIEKSSSEGKPSQSSKDRNSSYFGTRRNKNFLTAWAGGPFECSTCCKQFYSKLLYEYHSELCASKADGIRNMDEQSEIMTPNCNDSSKMSMGYLSHSLQTVEQIALIYNSNVKSRKVEFQKPVSKYYRCRLCGKAFLESWCFLRHCNRHKSLNSSKYTPKFKRKTFKCGCSKIFYNKNVLDYHAQNCALAAHVASASMNCTHVCSSCHKAYATKKDLQKHMLKHLTAKSVMDVDDILDALSKGNNHHELDSREFPLEMNFKETFSFKLKVEVE